MNSWNLKFVLTLEDLTKIEKEILLKHICHFFSLHAYHPLIFFGYVLDIVLVAIDKVNETEFLSGNYSHRDNM